MEANKKTGSYYTPPALVDFMISYLINEKCDFSRVLEPSVGDGRFLWPLESLANRVVGLELEKKKVEDLTNEIKSDKIEIYHQDFLEYVLKDEKKYSLVIGNPPYIRLKTMDFNSIELARKLCEVQGIEKSTMKNIWVAFVAGACRLLEEKGAIFFVLPIDFLQVQYAEKLRVYLEKKFNTIHVICFEEAIFQGIEQEVCLVYLANRENEIPHISYKLYEKSTDRIPKFQNEIKRNKLLYKWTNAILTDEEIEFLNKKSQDYIQINTVGKIAPGVVTGGNEYFILNAENVKRLKCEEFVLPILKKVTFMPEDRIVINQEVLSVIRNAGYPMYLLNLSKEEREFSAELKDYLEEIGEKKSGANNLELKKHFKCANRTPWYGVPLVSQGNVVFYKRFHIYPKLLINSALIHTTDAGYNIHLKEEYDAESLVFCFFNSVTLAQCEFNGRYYGGGVSEMVPSEFKALRLPYRKIDKKSIEQFQQKILNKESMSEIIEFVNKKTIYQDMSHEEVIRIERIRQKLMSRRIKAKDTKGK